MKLLFSIISVLLILTFTISCGSKKHTPIVKNKEINKETKVKIIEDIKVEKPNENVNKVHVNKTTQNYITTYEEIAMQKMREHKIPASITLAQGVLESSSGNSQLTRNSNNHFGIKCHKGWEGEKVYWDDDEKGECFRKYPNSEGSFEDHSQFLTSRSRYASLFQLPLDDYEAWAYGLKAAGYATDKAYPQKLIGIIKTYRLYVYDNIVLGKSFDIQDVADYTTYTVQKGEGLFTIANKHNMSVDELKNLNQLQKDFLYVGQELKVITPHTQKEYASGKENEKIMVENEKFIPDMHIVQSGETLFSVAKKYNIKLEDLKSFNDIISNDLVVGQSLKLKYFEKPKNAILKNTIPSNKEVHIVKQGETLFSIANIYQMSVDDLISINNLTNSEIKIGQTLIFSKEKQVYVENSTTDSIYSEYIVSKGDTMYSIAKKFNLSIDELMQLNNLENHQISVGQVLKIK